MAASPLRFAGRRGRAPIGKAILAGWVAITSALAPLCAAETDPFEGRCFSGTGDREYLELLDGARRMFSPDPEFQNVSMLYMPAWNGLVEGPTWDAWWIQNSYGTTYCALPFYQEPLVTFLENSHALWFSQMGDGKRVGAAPPFDWVAPDGCLCDAARPGWVVYKQGDGRTAIHDWGMEFTAAGLLMQSELLLISRDEKAIAEDLPKLERCAAFIETRRDPANNLFLAGPAGNLLAPSYAGWKKPDGTCGKAYLTGLSVTYVAALDRLIELEKLAGRADVAARFAGRRDTAKAALSHLTTDDGYLIRSLDPDGVRHGVFGAEKHGYFESSPNHDAICFRVADDARARTIFDKMASIAELRPHRFILPNYPSYDDMYEKPEGLWGYGTWVNGGHWSTCEARMIMAYYRLGKFDDARASMKQLMNFARAFRMDNPLVKRGSDVYQPNQPLNLTYDAFGPPAALVRGLFEYVYTADGLTLNPRIPPGITSLQQHFPIRFGTRQLFISTTGQGAITAVRVNGRDWKMFDKTSVYFRYESTPDRAEIQILMGDAKPGDPASKPRMAETTPRSDARIPELAERREWLRTLHERLVEAGLGSSYEAAHTKLALESIEVAETRLALRDGGKLWPLPEASQAAASKLYVQTAVRLCDGLQTVLDGYANSDDPHRARVFKLIPEIRTRQGR